MDNSVMVAEVNDGFFPMAYNLYKQLKVRKGCKKGVRYQVSYLCH
jgi:hypothetical protein